MILTAAPKKQINHKYINKSIDRWLDIHFGDTSFNGRVVIGHRKPKARGVYPMSVRSLSELRSYVKMIHVSSRLDYYITANTVSGVDRRKSDIFGLQNIVFDIDDHISPIQDVARFVEAFIWNAKKDLFNSIIPAPNTIVRTGRGVQLWWAIVPCYGGREVNLYYHNYIKRILNDQISSLLDEYRDVVGNLKVDASSMNAVGFFRIPCTYNTKARRYGSIEVLHDARLEQLDFVREIPSPRPVERPRGSQRYVPLLESDKDVLGGFHRAGARRVVQLIKLRNLRDTNEVVSKDGKAHEGHRNNFNFLVYNSLRMTYDHEEAMVRLRAFNSGFHKPMTEEELQSTVSTSRKKGGYRYTNESFYETLIEFFKITPEEQSAIGLFPYATKKPNASRDEVRRTLKEDRDHKIVELVESGKSQAETARILGIGKNTVWRVMKARAEEPLEPIETSEIECHQNGSIYGLYHTEGCVGRIGAVSEIENYSHSLSVPDEVKVNSS